MPLPLRRVVPVDHPEPPRARCLVPYTRSELPLLLSPSRVPAPCCLPHRAPVPSRARARVVAAASFPAPRLGSAPHRPAPRATALASPADPAPPLPPAHRAALLRPAARFAAAAAPRARLRLPAPLLAAAASLHTRPCTPPHTCARCTSRPRPCPASPTRRPSPAPSAAGSSWPRSGGPLAGAPILPVRAWCPPAPAR
nr:atherin-like [Aegilops tauschii subsp. strangulata]